jgi:hypothetical protein
MIAAHLSETNNAPHLARAALAGALNCEEAWIGVVTSRGGLAGAKSSYGWRGKEIWIISISAAGPSNGAFDVSRRTARAPVSSAR